MLHTEKGGEEIEGIKLALQSLNYRKVSVHRTIYVSVKFLFDKYQMTEEKKYLETALLQIQAYLEMGFTECGGIL